MTKKSLKNMGIKFCIFATCIAMLFTACVSTKNATGTEKSQVQIEQYTLDNGIPVFIEQNTANHVLTLNLTVEGGTTLLTPDQSGLENALFAMMTAGSEKYDYDTLTQLCYETQSGVSSSSGKMSSSVSLNCIDYYFDKMYPAFVDAFLHPSFAQREYETIMQGYEQSLQQSENDPSSILEEKVESVLCKDHPYQTSPNPTRESINNITIAAMKAQQLKILDSSRIFITAVGNYDSKKLVAKLNAAFGSIPAAKTPYTPVSIPPLNIGGDPVILENEIVAGSGYMTCILPAPTCFSEDVFANDLAADIYSDILFNIVREKHGACYSVGCTESVSKASCNMLYAIKVSDLENICKWFNEAQDLLIADKLIDSKDPKTGEYIYSTIEERIEEYKNSYINSLFSVAETNQGIASMLIGNKVTYNQPGRYLTLVDQIRAVTADDVKRCIDKYWTSDTKQWFIITGHDDVQRVNIE